MSEPSLEVLFAPAEFEALGKRDLTGTVCVVFDVLRATSSIIHALANGAARVIPVADIEEALAHRERDPHVLLAGERDGVRILRAQTGGCDFDLGNSPREFTAEAVRGQTIVMTTTNGTRALRACRSAQAIWIGTFLGLGALVNWIRERRPTDLVLVCAGTFDQASYEDTLAAGATVEAVWPLYHGGRMADSAAVARLIYQQAAPDLLGAMRWASNGRRLLSRPDLKDDVPFCLQRDVVQFTGGMTPDGVVTRIS